MPELTSQLPHSSTPGTQSTKPSTEANTADSMTPGDAPAPGTPAQRNRMANAADYHMERRRFLARARRTPHLRQRYLQSLLKYLLQRGAWSFGFFPVVLAAWIPLVLAEFNPVVMVQSLLPHLNAFVDSNPEVQARMLSTLTAGWVSIGLFFFLFDVVINPFRSPFQQEADIHMRAWSQSQGLVPPDEM